MKGHGVVKNMCRGHGESFVVMLGQGSQGSVKRGGQKGGLVLQTEEKVTQTFSVV